MSKSKPQLKCGNLEDNLSYQDCRKKNAEKIRIRLFKEQTRSKGSDVWAYNYLWHRKRVHEAKATVDTTPKYPAFVFTSGNGKYNKRVQNFVRIERENLKLTDRIKDAFLGEATVDNYRDPRCKSTQHLGIQRLGVQLELARKNISFANRLEKVTGTPEYLRCNLTNWYAKQENQMAFMAKYPLYWQDVLCKSHEAAALARAMDGNKPQVFFDLEIKDKKIGRIIIELEPMAGPVAVESFRAMFEGKSKKHRYQCSKLEKILPKLGWVFGNGVKSIVKASLPPKKYRMKHDKEGIVTLVNNGHGQFEAEFLITARELKVLDGKYLAIGSVTEGMEFLESLEEYILQDSRVIRRPMHIVRTGEFDPEHPPPEPKLTRKCPGSKKSSTNEEGEEEGSEQRYEAEDEVKPEDDEEEESQQEEEVKAMQPEEEVKSQGKKVSDEAKEPGYESDAEFTGLNVKRSDVNQDDEP